MFFSLGGGHFTPCFSILGGFTVPETRTALQVCKRIFLVLFFGLLIHMEGGFSIRYRISIRQIHFYKKDTKTLSEDKAFSLVILDY